MWRNKQSRGAAQRGKGFRQERGNRDRRDRYRDQGRDELDSYSSRHEDDRATSDWNWDQGSYSEREDARYHDDRDRYTDKYQSDAFADDRHRYLDNVYDSREVHDRGRSEYESARNTDRYDRERDYFVREDSRHEGGKRDYVDDRRDHYRDDWDTYRRDEPGYGEERLDYDRDDRGHYSRDERLDYRDGAELRDDRDFPRDGSRQSDRGRVGRSNDYRDKNQDTYVTGRKDDRSVRSGEKNWRKENEKYRNDGRNQYGGHHDRIQGNDKTANDSWDRQSARSDNRVFSYNKSKFSSGDKPAGTKFPRHQQQRFKGARGDQKNDRSQFDEPRDKVYTSTDRSNERDKRLPEVAGRDKTTYEEKRSESSIQGSVRDNRASISQTKPPVSISSRSRPDVKDKLSPRSRSRSDSNKGRKRDSESERQNNSLERHSSRSSLHAGSSSTDVKVESRKLYGSFHDDDAISIMVEDDRFENETRKYLEHDSFSADKEKTSHNDETFQLHADCSASVFEEKVPMEQKDSNVFKTPANKRFSDTGKNRFNQSTGRKRISDRWGNRNPIRTTVTQNSTQNRKSYVNKQVTHRYNNMRYNPRFGKRFEMGDFNKKHHKYAPRHDNEKQTSEDVSVRIGRTGAVLSEDRRNNDNTEGRGNESRGYVRNKYSSVRYRNTGFNTSDKVKRKYFGKKSNFNKQSFIKRNEMESDRKERFDKLKNERDPKDFQKSRQVEDEMGEEMEQSGKGENLIFIPAAELADGEVGEYSQYEGGGLDSSGLPLGPLQQLPLQFIPSGLPPPTAPQGTEYVFIPFDQLTGVGDLQFNQPVFQEADAVNRELVGQLNDQSGVKTEPGTGDSKSELRKETKEAMAKSNLILKAQRRQRLLKIRKERRKALEKRLERKVFLKLIRSTKETIRAEAALQREEKKTRPLIKRISPPSATAGSHGQSGKNQDWTSQGNNDADYDVVSDLDDITDDENGDNFKGDSKSGELRRSTFRKPGEPRMGTRSRDFVGSSSQRAGEAYHSPNVRKVVERDVPHGSNRSPSEDGRHYQDGTDISLGRAPLQITVNNDQFSEESMHEDKTAENHRRFDSNRRAQDEQGRYSTAYRENQGRGPNRWGNQRNREFTRHSDTSQDDGKGKYGREATVKPYPRNYRERTEANLNKQFISNRRQNFDGSNISNRSKFRNIHRHQSAPSTGNLNLPFSPPHFSVAQGLGSVDHSLSSTVQQPLGYNQTNMQLSASDPSLPPVSHGVVNMSPFSVPGSQADMSMPPTMALPNSPMPGVILPQRQMSQSFQAQGSLMQQQQQGQSMLSNAQQSQALTQQAIHVGPPLNAGRHIQPNVGMNQLVASSGVAMYPHIQSQMHGGNKQQPQQNQFDNTLGNQRQGLINPMAVPNNQALISGNPMSLKDSFVPSSPNSALQSLKASNVPSSLVVSQNFTSRASGSPVYGTARGRGGFVKVPRASLPMSSTVSRHTMDNRRAVERGAGNVGAGKQYGVGPSQPGKLLPQDTFVSSDIDDEFGELLCVKCDKVFLSESVMRRHSKWHILAEAGVRELRCDSCEEGFVSSVAYDAHMAEKHKGGNSWRMTH